MHTLVPSLFKTSTNYLEYSRCYSESAFALAKVMPEIEVFHLNKKFSKDRSENKVNLGIGVYRNDESKPFIFPVIKNCELQVVKDKALNHEYLHPTGNSNFTKLATELALGDDCEAIKEKRTLSVQTLSGTGAIRLAADFICSSLKRRTCYVPSLSWDNHRNIFKTAGFKHINSYPYWNRKKAKLDMPNLLCTLADAPEGAVILLQSSAHNPTGQDPSHEQWRQIFDVITQRKMLTIFDSAYQGFATGDPYCDAWPLRHFVGKGHEAFIAQSFSKIMGLYNERVGNLIIVLKDGNMKQAISTTLARQARVNYSSPPAFGCRVVEKVLTDECNRKEWLQTLSGLVTRLTDMRKGLVCRLKDMKTPGNWDYILGQVGMFSLLNLTPQHIEQLEKKHIYLMKSGRICICGLNTKNIDYVSKSISDVVKQGSSAK